MMTSLLLAGFALPAISSGEAQPDTLSQHVNGYFYSAGRSYLGVDIKDVTADRVSALKLKDERGVEITLVDSDAPAGKAGLREHDVILEFNGAAVDSEEQLRRLIRETPPGRTVTLGISRDGAPMKVSVQLADHSSVVAQSKPWVLVPPVPRTPAFPRNSIDIPNIQIQTYSYTLGVQTENLTRQLGEYFGVKDGEGVLIRSVEKGSAAEKAGLKAGDVIVRAGNEKLTDRSDLNHILRSHRSGGKLNLVIMRDRKEMPITVTLPERGARDNSWLEFDSDSVVAALDNAAVALAGLDLGSEFSAIQTELFSKETEKAFEDAMRELEKSNKSLFNLRLDHDMI